jgi:hypothetical protein
MRSASLAHAEGALRTHSDEPVYVPPDDERRMLDERWLI